MRTRVTVFIICMTVFFTFAGFGSFYLIKSLNDAGSSAAEAIAGSQEDSNAVLPAGTDNQDGTESNNGNSTDTGSSSEDPENVEETVITEHKELKIAATGDILLGRSVGIMVEKQPERYRYPFLNAADMLKEADVVFGNLEEPVTASTKGLTPYKEGGKYVLKSKPEAIEGITYAGFNLLSLANNHILDYYEEGLFDTFDTLDEHGIAYAGAGRNLDEARRLAVIEKQGMKIGLLAYTEMAEVMYKGDPPLRFIAADDRSGVAPSKRDYILEDIKKARDQVDILIVSLHWGVEYEYVPRDYEVTLAHEIMDSGADILLGHHPHRPQGIEIYDGKPIFYSLGNFLFDQNNPLNQQSFFVQMEYTNEKLTSLEAIPFKILNKSQIVPQTGDGAKEMLERQLGLSKDLGSDCIIENDRLVFRFE